MQDAQRRPHDAERAPGVSIVSDVVEVHFDRLGYDNYAGSPPQGTSWSEEPHRGAPRVERNVVAGDAGIGSQTITRASGWPDEIYVQPPCRPYARL